MAKQERSIWTRRIGPDWPFQVFFDLVCMAGGSIILVIGAAGAPTIAERVSYGCLGCVGLGVGSVGLMRQSVLKMRRVRTRRHRARQGLCVECGYNLKGLSHLHCPECGHQNVPYERYDEYAPLEDNAGE